MEDGHTLFDYDVGLNDIVQLMIRPSCSNSSDTTAVITNGITLINGNDKDPMNCNLHSESEKEAMDTVSVVKSDSIKAVVDLGMSMRCCSTAFLNKKYGSVCRI